ncbi:hypothetical protein LG003_09975 [Photorhabdus kleinii]|uniref:hypothetical protein n=1 Tax=Photorhabdus kleinii TaxID=768034 RepID=UPI0021D4FAE9|nr:hypothetical protein [Photorhabdus kleinii]MCT8343174.1 hypothetical protein [Photorhabdus kleinii]
MMNEILDSYNAIIKYTFERAILLAEQSPFNREYGRREIAGLCPLQGPTGGGKSSSLFRKSKEDGIPPGLEIIQGEGYQAILVTHRWNILHDIYHNAVSSTDTNGNPFKVSVLYAQDENIVSAVIRQPLPHEQGLTDCNLPDPFLSLDELAQKKIIGEFSIKLRIEQECRNVINLVRSLKYRGKDTSVVRKFRQYEERELKKVCSSIERYLLRVMTCLEKAVKKLKKEYGDEHKLTYQAIEKLTLFRGHPWIRRVFPAIAWHDEKQHLLIMTTQKMFSSFYDGKRKVRMSSVELSGHVIFIDEFDYQADILQMLLAQAQLVQEPPECLGQLLEGGRRLLSRMCYVLTPPVPELNRELQAFLDDLEKELHDKNIDLNHSRSLVIPLQQYKQGHPFGQQYLFRSDHLVTSKPLSISKAEHGYEVSLIGSSDDYEVNIGDFLRLMEQYIRRFTLLLSQFSSDESEAREYLIRLNRLLFDPVNDYRPSYYSSALPNLSLFALPRTSLIELDWLRESNLLPNSHANIYGLTNWLLKPNEAEADLDPLRIQIRRAFMPTTPEGLLVSLASRNLVFAMSATSYIERALGHFDLRWIQSALRYVAESRNPEIKVSFLDNTFENRPEAWFKKPIPYVQTEEDRRLQQNMINELIKRKADVRKTDLSVVVHNFDALSGQSEFDEFQSHLFPEFFQQPEDNISEFTYKYRLSILLKLLEIIRQAASNLTHRGHLAFVNSTRYLKKWLLDEQASSSRDALSWFESDYDFYPQLPEQHALNGFSEIFVPIRALNQEILICLLTAESQKQNGFEKAYHAAFDTGRIVIVLTQIASATNGINLNYFLPESGKPMDLTCLYLLESRHFYFSKFESADEELDEMSHAGFQLRNLEKLLRIGELSRKKHRSFIMPLMINSNIDISRLNSLYKFTEDYIKNTAADIQQQVGRVERAWTEVPNIEIHLSDSIAHDLQRFASLPIYGQYRNQISDLNRQLFDFLLNRFDKQKASLLSVMMSKHQTGEQAVEVIDNQLVPALRAARSSDMDGEMVEKVWHELGRAVLQYDFSWKPKVSVFGIESELKHWACFERPIDSYRTGEVWYDPGTWQFFAERREGLKLYNLQRLYHPIQTQPAILNWFNRKGFRTSVFPYASELEQQYAFHPLVVQRILQGRLGEEAIRALLDAESIRTRQCMTDTRLLELYDFNVIGTRYRVDAKYWGTESLDNADDTFIYWVETGMPEDKVPMGLKHKLLNIREIEGSQVRLIIANFITSRGDASLTGFGVDFQTLPIEKADILFLSGCISSENNQFTSGFKWLIRMIKNELMG